MSKYFKKFGICLFSLIAVFAVGIFPTASAHYNGDHIDLEENGDYFVLDLIPTPVEEVLQILQTTQSRYFMNIYYEEGLNGSTILYQEYLGRDDGSNHVMLNQRYWSATVKLPYIGGVITSSRLNSYVDLTNYCSVTLEVNIDSGQYVNSDVILDVVTPTFGSTFVLVQEVDNTLYYTWNYILEDGSLPPIVSDLLEGTEPNVNGDVPFLVPFTNEGQMAQGSIFVTELMPFTITNKPEGAIIPQPDSTTIIVGSIDDLGEAIDASISAGVEEINNVVLQQTDAITGAVESQTEAILNYRSNVDMSVSENAEVATKLAEESLITGQIHDGYTDLEYDSDVGSSIDSNFGEGVSFLSSAMQMIFDFGVGQLVLILLTIGTSLFIIGRSMR